MADQRDYTVYVIEFDDEVLSNARFRAANPVWNPAKPRRMDEEKR